MHTAKSLVLLGLGVLVLIGPASAQESASRALPAITVVSVETATLTDRVHASGLIAAVEQVFVQPQIEGQSIDMIVVDVGDQVVAGDILAGLSESALKLQRSELEAGLASAEAAIAQAEAQRIEAEAVRDEAVKSRDRTVSLVARGATNQAAADQAISIAATAIARVTVAVQAMSAARAQLRVVEAQIADVDLNLQRTRVAAPVSGEIVERNAMVGNIATAVGEPMFVIVRDGQLEVRADVAEQDILHLAPGQATAIRVVGLADSLGGTVRLVEPTVNATSRLGKVRISIDQPSRVRSGMFAEAEIVVARRNGLSLPMSAVGGGSDGATVLRVREGVVEQVAVVIGIRNGDRVEVLQGLAQGDTVVAKAGAFVRDGDRINPVPAAASDTATN